MVSAGQPFPSWWKVPLEAAAKYIGHTGAICKIWMQSVHLIIIYIHIKFPNLDHSNIVIQKNVHILHLYIFVGKGDMISTLTLNSAKICVHTEQ